MFTFLIRTVGLWMVAAGVASIVVDGMKSIAAGRPVLTPLRRTWSDLAPASLQAAEAAVGKYTHPLVWDTLAQFVLLLPTWAVLLVIGSMLVALGSRRKRDAAYVV
ncbi:hypothetical protein [Prosthecomicrobium sp. N25]|uniref:hypothetical protein n=1 Tax=Prosthecomicrobium sp. N25 TaxID=3129254 RepID=UPI00307714AA